MMDFKSTTFHYDPYPIGLAVNVFEPNYYQHLLDSYPSEKFFGQLSGGYKKWSLSTINNPEEYTMVLKTSPTWSTVHKFLTDPWFVDHVFATVRSHGVPVKREPGSTYKTRWEFSSLPTDGGFILPHTDLKSKVVTLIVPLTDKADDSAGTMVLRRKYPDRLYRDYAAPIEDFDVAHAYQFKPNCAVLFVKSDHSWHAVGPLQGAPGGWRRSLTINIERFEVK